MTETEAVVDAVVVEETLPLETVTSQEMASKTKRSQSGGATEKSLTTSMTIRVLLKTLIDQDRTTMRRSVREVVEASTNEDVAMIEATTISDKVDAAWAEVLAISINSAAGRRRISTSRRTRPLTTRTRRTSTNPTSTPDRLTQEEAVAEEEVEADQASIVIISLSRNLTGLTEIARTKMSANSLNNH